MKTLKKFCFISYQLPWVSGWAMFWLGLFALAGSLVPALGMATELRRLESPYPQDAPVAIGTRIYYSACTARSGCELWIAEGLSAALAEDLVPGSDGAHPDSFISFAESVFFAAKDPEHGRRLWRRTDSGVDRIDGSPAVPQFAVVFGGALVFRTDSAEKKFEVWRFDGSDFRNFGGIRAWSRFEELNQRLYFAGSNPGSDQGVELWRLEDDKATVAVEIGSGENSSWPKSLVAHNGKLYFSACETGGFFGCTSPRYLYSFDGEKLSTHRAIEPEEYSQTVVFRNQLYLWAKHGTRFSLCRLGSEGCEFLAHGSHRSRDGPIVVGDRMYFTSEYKGEHALLEYDGHNLVHVDHKDLKRWSVGYLVSSGDIGYMEAWDEEALRLWAILPDK